MRHPVQRLFICSKTNRLFAGIAGHIQVFDINSGDLLSQWEAPPAGPPPASIKKKHKQSQMLTSISRTEKPPTKIPNQGSEGAQAGVDGAVVEAEEGTPVKKRKVGEITASPNANLAKPVTSENLPAPAEPSHKRKKVGPRAGLGWEGIRGVNSVTSIVGTASGRYLVVATNEDKTVRVFDVVRGTGEKGKLELLNERQMPKRPCAVRILEKKAEMTVEEEKEKDGVVILCGDKFGDVYSLPLLYTPKSAPEPTSTPTQQSGTSTAEPKAKIEHRIAGGGIITTRRNKIAAQKAAKAISRNSVANLETKELPFENTHLLGHVSLLTDVLPITLEVEIEGGRKVDRTWILTADKDEHIRVSRYPKAYVIEGFCLGHTLYVTSLMVLSGDKNTLISGGGDDYLLRWNWLSGKAVQKILLREHIMNAVEVVKANRRSQGQEKNKKNDPMDVVSTTEKADENEDQEEDEEFLISVTGIWEYVDTARGKYRILVAVEGLPALLVFTDSGPEGFVYSTTIGAHGNVLDVAVRRSDGSILVSVDPESTGYEVSKLGDCGVLIDEVIPEPGNPDRFVVRSLNGLAGKVNGSLSWEIDAQTREKLQEFLYGAKNLRKFEGENPDKGD